MRPIGFLLIFFPPPSQLSDSHFSLPPSLCVLCFDTLPPSYALLLSSRSLQVEVASVDARIGIIDLWNTLPSFSPPPRSHTTTVPEYSEARLPSAALNDASHSAGLPQDDVSSSGEQGPDVTKVVKIVRNVSLGEPDDHLLCAETTYECPASLSPRLCDRFYDYPEDLNLMEPMEFWPETTYRRLASKTTSLIFWPETTYRRPASKIKRLTRCTLARDDVSKSCEQDQQSKTIEFPRLERKTRLTKTNFVPRRRIGVRRARWRDAT
ncbi:hypothetical protein ARMSODRAFT_1028355 [Armillaria solidipes]|uniref:Uncharacterized protein n=1 Tax=Armillaria solidipes TaxID=1076256 RepID=A0A2H3AX07_9AGAR|nr:hypothetical protein ARMSODRAFT_1028355 [Armillaria solidipes]